MLVAPPQPFDRPHHANPSVRRVAFSTLGCKVNAFETEVLAETLTTRTATRESYQRVHATATADVHIINTCCVTTEAERQARQLIRRIIRNNPRAWVVVTGCYAEINPTACAQLPGVDLVVGNRDKLALADLLAPLYRGELPPIIRRDLNANISLPQQLLSGYAGRSRAFVQIQQGCDQGCTFCIIHTARGPSRSFAPELIARQCERLVQNGYGEIVLCGVDIGSYGRDLATPMALATLLADLLRRLDQLGHRYRLRLSSIDPIHLTDELVAILARPQICPQLHLSLQSANTLILKRMKRRATRAQIYDRIRAARAVRPELVLSADILVGFPTELETHFTDTITAIDELDIAYPHVFGFSARPGTPAARIPAQIPPAVRKQRVATARAMGRQVWQRLARRQVGDRRTVLLETARAEFAKNPGRLVGRSANYFPVVIAAEAWQAGWAEVTITGLETSKGGASREATREQKLRAVLTRSDLLHARTSVQLPIQSSQPIQAQSIKIDQPVVSPACVC